MDATHAERKFRERMLDNLRETQVANHTIPASMRDHGFALPERRLRAMSLPLLWAQHGLVRLSGAVPIAFCTSRIPRSEANRRSAVYETLQTRRGRGDRSLQLDPENFLVIFSESETTCLVPAWLPLS